MSFVDREKRASPASVTAVVIVHVAIGYAIVSGLATTVVTHFNPPTKITSIPIDQPPPPETQKLPKTPAKRVADIFVPPTTVDTQRKSDVEVQPGPPVKIDFGPTTIDPPKVPVQPSQAKNPTIVGNRAGWVTTDDYPSAAIRSGAEGTTAILVTIGVDGRVTDCRVTASSGDTLLDQIACKVYSRRARFTPALDDAGHPMAFERADRVRWQLPPQ